MRRRETLTRPGAPSGPERIEDAVRRDTAAPSVLGFGVFVIRFGMWRLAVYASACGVWRFMLGVPLVDLARSWQIMADLGRFSPETDWSALNLRKDLQESVKKRMPKQQLQQQFQQQV